MSFRRQTDLNWNSQDLKNDKQSSDFLTDQLLFVFVKEIGLTRGIEK
jgi:hypothetical protein